MQRWIAHGLMKLPFLPRHPSAEASGPHGSRRSPEKRLVVRRSTPVWPFVWRGLVPLMGLLFVAWYAMGPMARGVESRVRDEVRSALDLRGFSWVSLKVSGQHVELSGAPPSGNAQATAQALAIAKGATCSSGLWRSACAVDVAARFENELPASVVIAGPGVKSAGPLTSAPTAAGDTQQAKTVANAPAAVPGATVPPAAAHAATAVLASPLATNARNDAAAAIKSCEAAMKRTTAATRIEFETGEAVIALVSGPVLDALAKEVRLCPGVVRIEGHTDTVGGAGDNQKLSLARAFAVRDALVKRGLPPAQLLAEGFGEEKPIASNKTPDGRAKNRRIEFRALMPPNI